tara:strand:+ start:619 stop:867 length:249 start_codon:yes stop_codon:yes gene_type:complete
MKVQLQITYNWSCNEHLDTPGKHEEALREDAESRIHDMMKEGNFSGELHTSVRFGKEVVPEEDEEDGLTYSGWWSANYESIT